ncbi:MAG: IS3 family transposase [Microbacteriaceae bacterium]
MPGAFPFSTTRPTSAARIRSPAEAAIRDAFEQAHGRYGHRRIHRVLTRQGWTVAKKTVLKLMRELGPVCKVRRRRRYQSWKGEIGTIAPNTQDRDFAATAPNQEWVSNVTEFRVGHRKVYLSPMIDLFDRSVVAHSVGLSPSLEQTNTSQKQAVATLEPGQQPLVHADQGFQYRDGSWRRILDRVGATQSMSRKATCLDNAVAENFFGHLKEELFHHDSFASVHELMTAIDDYISWFNTDRISTTLKGLSPVQYGAQALAA